MALWPTLTLIVLATVMPELFSGSTPPIGFLNPILLLFLTLGYGAAVLLIRELTVRWRSGLLASFFIGLSYSVFNEGLLAKTLILQQNLPLQQYDHYGYYGGISFPWAAGIGAWHACASVIFPIAFTHCIFPQDRERPWLKARTALVSTTILLVLACAIFLGTSDKGVKGTPRQLAWILGLMLAGFVIARMLKPNPLAQVAASSRCLPLLLGFSVLIPFWGLAAIASARLAPGLYFAGLLAAVSLYGWILRSRQWITPPAFLFFALGWYLHNAFQSLLLIGWAMKNPGRALVTAVLDAAILLFLFRRSQATRLFPNAGNNKSSPRAQVS